ncbi:hypothetical protein DICPUDRAFT_147470 [Dictyostelium purpureum]|uniref:Uncharacterized protein n=1 Tax=Dictyostelium purpureum TaxID=5786 RepID=F0Z8K1_DICPU|nr:uncharacterized protein DICPUDRAFT_147470 [Dictyostelium purpureum]EGC39739.1 hypothetical protein DICPUDRAFT_147470 [Dictyostelium purpureum]|eukprot:XP_003283725.1 hypothetical protein DICPUDRAFT_147470 [Dictyostelium purpureum]
MHTHSYRHGNTDNHSPTSTQEIIITLFSGHAIFCDIIISQEEDNQEDRDTQVSQDQKEEKRYEIEEDKKGEEEDEEYEEYEEDEGRYTTTTTTNDNKRFIIDNGHQYGNTKLQTPSIDSAIDPKKRKLDNFEPKDEKEEIEDEEINFSSFTERETQLLKKSEKARELNYK